MPNRLMLNENELAERWGVSPKTLQRWRTEKRGLAYIKLSKRVCYAIDDILAYEHQQKRLVKINAGAVTEIPTAGPLPAPPTPVQSASKAVTEDGPGIPTDGDLINSIEASHLTKLPISYFTQATLRNELGIPHYYVGRLVRFKLKELRQREMAVARKAFDIPDAPACINVEATLAAEQKFTLREALERLCTGSIQ